MASTIPSAVSLEVNPRANKSARRMFKKDLTPLGPIIIVIVGVDAKSKTFHVHRDLIASSSLFFHKALNGQFKEKDGVVTLPEQDAAKFEIYVNWLYFGELGSKDEEETDASGSELGLLSCLYILGDFMGDDLFCNNVIDAIIDQVLEFRAYPLSLAPRVYWTLPSSSPLRTLIVDFYVYSGSSSWFEPKEDGKVIADIAQGPKEFWMDMAMKLMKVIEEKGRLKVEPWVVDRCRYHKHANGEPRCADTLSTKAKELSV